MQLIFLGFTPESSAAPSFSVVKYSPEDMRNMLQLGVGAVLCHRKVSSVFRDQSRRQMNIQKAEKQIFKRHIYFNLFKRFKIQGNF